MRKRPGMYIGSTGVRGLHHLVYEVVDNSVDEALAGYCDTVSVTIHPDDSVTVIDNGRGIPVAKMEKEDKSALEVVLTVLHAGGKFGEGGGYKVSGGLHGVGVSVVNALSDELTSPSSATATTGRSPTCAASRRARSQQGEPTDETGTTIHFRPDDDVFETLTFEYSHARAAPARDGVPHRAACGSRSPTSAARRRSSRRVPLRGRDRGLRPLPQREQGPARSRRSSSSRARATRARSRSRCSGTAPTRSRSSRSPTTSTRTRAARTSRASARR